jgi:PAS domain S-box-containing protein
MSDDIQIMYRTLERERLARKKAENLLEVREAELLGRHHELTTVVSIMRSQLDVLEDAVNSMTVATVTLEVDGTIRLFNRHAQRLFGLSAEEVLGTSFRSLMPQIFRRDDAQRLREDLLLGQQATISKAKGRRRDGSSFKVDVTCSATVKKDRRRLTLLITLPDPNDKLKGQGEETHVMKKEGISTAHSASPNASRPPSGDLLKFLASYEQLRSKKKAGASAEQMIERIDSMIGGLISSSFDGDIPIEFQEDEIVPPTLRSDQAPADPKPGKKKRVVNTRAQCANRVVRKQDDANKLLQSPVEESNERTADAAEVMSQLHPTDDVAS